MSRKVLLALSVFVVVASLSAGFVRFRPGQSVTPAGIASPYSFNTAGWVVGSTLQKWADVVKESIGGRASDEEQAATVKSYFALCDEIGGLQYRVTQTRLSLTAPGPGTASSNEAALAELEAQRAAMQSEVESIIEGQVARVVADQGLASQAGFKFLFPPVNFKFDELPSILIVSPRDRIEIEETSLLKSHLTDAETATIESQVEALGLSALVEGIGGIATYPTMLPEGGSLRWIIPTVAHEWLHQYFFFQPLGRSYGSTYEMTTINETAADIAGNEIGASVLKQYYGIDVERERAASPPPAPGDFDFGKEMNSIRVAVDEYLAGGEIEQAEQFMEQKRLELVEHGYLIRKLNQAYFAFHGSYAAGPGTPNPIGQEVQALRRQTSSVGNFVRAVSQVSSRSHLQQLVDQGNLIQTH